MQLLPFLFLVALFVVVVLLEGSGCGSCGGCIAIDGSSTCSLSGEKEIAQRK